MSREIYKRSVAPHLARAKYDSGIYFDSFTEKRIQDYIRLMNYYEQHKDNIKLFYFPALTGNKIGRTFTGDRKSTRLNSSH